MTSPPAPIAFQAPLKLSVGLPRAISSTSSAVLVTIGRAMLDPFNG